ncbi:MAG: IclR family transcriptional regulator [Bacteroidota bacterium]
MGRSRKDGEGETVQAVTRAMVLLEILAREDNAISLSVLAKKAQLKPATTHRLLNTMMNRGFIEQDPISLRYRLGIKTFEIGNAALNVNDLRTISRPFLKSLAQQTNETTNLAILDGAEVVYIDQLESTNIVIVKMFARVGSRGPAYCTGTGKVLLADLPEEELKKRLAKVEFIKFTEHTVTDINELVKVLNQIRKDGFALDFSERDEGVICIAAPIRNFEKRVQAAISVSSPAQRMDRGRIEGEILPLLLKVAQQISERLGFRDNSQIGVSNNIY